MGVIVPFPANLESLLAAGYRFAKTEACPVCREPVEVFSTPGGRTIAMNPMCCLTRPAVRHFETCNPKQEAANGNTRTDVQDTAGRDSDSDIARDICGQPGFLVGGRPVESRNLPESLPVGGLDAQSAGIKLYGVTDPNHQLLAVGYEPVSGTLVCQFAKGKGQYAGVPEDEYLKLRKVPFAYHILTTNIKGKYPYTKLN
jgi:hypothetical protein